MIISIQFQEKNNLTLQVLKKGTLTLKLNNYVSTKIWGQLSVPNTQLQAKSAKIKTSASTGKRPFHHFIMRVYNFENLTIIIRQPKQNIQL